MKIKLTCNYTVIFDTLEYFEPSWYAYTLLVSILALGTAGIVWGVTSSVYIVFHARENESLMFIEDGENEADVTSLI